MSNSTHPVRLRGVTAMEIKALRTQMGLTQEEFAHEVTVTVPTVNRWENGHAKPSKLARRAIWALIDYNSSHA